MALAKEEGYLELDVKLAARWWLAPNGRNFGLSLEVEDTDGQRKPAAHYFRPRNCSLDGKPIGRVKAAKSHRLDGHAGTRSDELSDARAVPSPVLELTVVEVPEGRHIVELPSSGSKTRSEEVDSANDESEQAADQDEAPRRHRTHRPHEEQADEAARTYQRPAASHKHRAAQRNPHARGQPAPMPTLATLEDHDLFKEAPDDDGDQLDFDEVRLMRAPAANLFIQRMLQHQQQHSRHGQRARDRPEHSVQ